jgi:hypothetical protein
MTEKLLNAAQVRTAVEQMRREAVAQSVWRGALTDANAGRPHT